MAYTVRNSSNESIRWTVRAHNGDVVFESDILAPGAEAQGADVSRGSAEDLSISVPQYDSEGRPHGSIGWGSVWVHQDGCVIVYGNWNFDVRRDCSKLDS